MDTHRLEQLRCSLRTLVDNYKATIDLMEGTLALLSDALALDPLTYFQTRTPPQAAAPGPQPSLVDPATFAVNFRGKICFLGGGLPFKFLARLARRPNAYVSYEDLLADVWDRNVSDAAIRGVAKILRQKLRRAGLADLADAVDGTVPGHYALKLDL